MAVGVALPAIAGRLKDNVTRRSSGWTSICPVRPDNATVRVTVRVPLQPLVGAHGVPGPPGLVVGRVMGTVVVMVMFRRTAAGIVCDGEVAVNVPLMLTIP